MIHHSGKVYYYNKEEKTITIRKVGSGEEYEESYDKLILSPGARAIRPSSIIGVDRDNVFTVKNVVDIDRLKKYIDENNIEDVAVKCQARNSYTTCMWHNLRTCRILYDKNGNLIKYKEKYSFDYPEQLKKNIINHQLKLIDSSLPAYPNQIKKAIERGDSVSVNHRISEFLASYFDMIFAINSLTHPGEKRLIQLCKKQCKILPENFEENLELLFSHMFSRENHLQCIEDIENIVKNVKKII